MARRALSPATLLVAQAVERALDEQDRALLVACSGGADSLALAAGTVAAVRRRDRSASSAVSAVVVDHGLQPDSALSATMAREQLVGLGLAEVAVVRVAVDARSGTGSEAAARESRYRALATAAAEQHATVLLGHTLDDQAETVLLGLARGSGPRSLAGMAVRSGRYLRPLLALRRSVTHQACAELGLEPWQDPHNADDSYARARVRRHVLPLLEVQLGPGIAENLARTAWLAREDSDLLDELAVRAYPEGTAQAEARLDCDSLARAAPPLRRRLLRRWLLARGATEVTFSHALAVEELVTRWHGQAGVDLPGVRVVRAGDWLSCEPKVPVAG